MPRRKPAVTPSDRAYGWTIGCLGGLAAYFVFNSVAFALTNDVLWSLPIGVAAGLAVGAIAYNWASRAKARWRSETGAAPQQQRG